MANYSDEQYIGALAGGRFTQQGAARDRISWFFTVLNRDAPDITKMGIILIQKPTDAPSNQAEVQTHFGRVDIRGFVIFDGSELSATVVFTAAPCITENGHKTKLLALKLAHGAWLDESGRNHSNLRGQFDIESVMQLLQARQLRANTELYESFLRAPV